MHYVTVNAIITGSQYSNITNAYTSNVAIERRLGLLNNIFRTFFSALGNRFIKISLDKYVQCVDC